MTLENKGVVTMRASKACWARRNVKKNTHTCDLSVYHLVPLVCL